MAKQIITLEITYDPKVVDTTINPFQHWLAGFITNGARWILGVEVLSTSPVYWQGEEDPDDPDLRKKLSEKFLTANNL